MQGKEKKRYKVYIVMDIILTSSLLPPKKIEENGDLAINIYRNMIVNISNYTLINVRQTSKYINKWLVFCYKGGISSLNMSKNWFNDIIDRLEKHKIEIIEYRSHLENIIKFLKHENKAINWYILLMVPYGYDDYILKSSYSLVKKIQNMETELDLITCLMKKMEYGNNNVIVFQKYLGVVHERNMRLDKSSRILVDECKK